MSERTAARPGFDWVISYAANCAHLARCQPRPSRQSSATSGSSSAKVKAATSSMAASPASSPILQTGRVLRVERFPVGVDDGLVGGGRGLVRARGGFLERLREHGERLGGELEGPRTPLQRLG